jgi:hypothetical protein
MRPLTSERKQFIIFPCIPYRDRVPTVLVKEWQLTCTMFDGDQLLGPVPTLFADNVEVKNFC